MTGRSSSAGFTLVEVVVALLVLEVGLLAVAGTLVVAARTLGRARVELRGVGEIESVLDSLAAGASPGAYTRTTDDGRLTWSVSADGALRIRYVSRGGRVSIAASGAVPTAVGGGS